MKRALIFLFHFYFLAAMASSQISIDIGESQGQLLTGDLAVSLYMQNAEPVSGFQFEFADDMSILNIDSAIVTERTQGFTVWRNGNHMLLLHLEGDSITAGSGAILNMTFKIGETNQTGIDTLRFSRIPVFVSSRGDRIDNVIVRNGTVRVDDQTALAPKPGATPSSFVLKQNYPNPFNAFTIIRFGLEKSNHARIILYNEKGEQVKVIADQVYPAGMHQVTFNADNFSSGIYFYKLITPVFSQMRKMVLIR